MRRRTRPSIGRVDCLIGADRQWRSKPNPPGRWRGDGRPPLQTALPDGDAITLAQGSTTLSQGPTGSAPGTASVYKMRLRADPHRSQITTNSTSNAANEARSRRWAGAPKEKIAKKHRDTGSRLRSRRKNPCGTPGSNSVLAESIRQLCYEVVMLAVITTSGRCYECYEVL